MKKQVLTDDSARERDRPGEGSDRGLSDVVAFVLTFGIIIASMALVSTAGIDQLTQLRDAEQIQTAERSMQAAAGEIDHLEDGDSFRVLELGLGDGDVWVNESTISVNVTTDDGGGWDDARPFNVSSLEHRFTRSSRDVSVAYESGAVIRSDSATPSSQPEWHVDEDTAIVTLVNITTGETIRADGGYRQDIVIGADRSIPQGAPATDPDETLQLLAERNMSENTIVNRTQVSDSVNISVDVSKTANRDQWARYLNNTGWDPLSGDYTFYADEIDTGLIRQTNITIS